MNAFNSAPNDNNLSEYLRDGFFRYIVDYKGRTESTGKHYLNALRTISKRLIELGIVSDSIYEITDCLQLLEARNRLSQDQYYIDLNLRGNNMYSAGLNHYIDFVSGEGFTGDIEAPKVLDRPLPVSKTESIIAQTWKRSGILRLQALELANYQCEIDNSHITFISESNSKPYMEGHHLIPISKQISFSNSLDNYANIICLCPICHRQLHHGLYDDKKRLLSQIYEQRGSRLSQSGLSLSKDEFISFATSNRDESKKHKIKAIKAVVCNN